MEHLTTTKKGGKVLHITGGPDAAALSQALENEMQRAGDTNKSRVARLLIINGERETTAQERNSHALQIIKLHTDGDEPGGMVGEIAKALLGCPATTTYTFVGESDEYKKFWKQEDEI